MSHAARLRELLAGPAFIAPGCYDGLTALQIQQAGFDCAYLSGASVAFTRLGRPDIGPVHAPELLVGAVVSPAPSMMRSDPQRVPRTCLDPMPKLESQVLVPSFRKVICACCHASSVLRLVGMEFWVTKTASFFASTP